ncbi:MAG: hypothetical protein KGI28_09470 [Thaumarchaeota archaeon]|nr:hypothetical protein [Nitrososphaerota archaeon]
MLRLGILLISIVAITLVGSASASSDITLSAPIAVDTTGNQKSEIHVGDIVAFSSLISNHSDGQKRFTYLVSILNQDNQLITREGLSADIGPNQEFTVAQSWMPKETGTYNVQTVVLDGYMISSPLTDQIDTQVTVK